MSKTKPRTLWELFGDPKREKPKAAPLNVRLEAELLGEFDAAWKRAGFTTRAKALRAAMRMLIARAPAE